MRIAKSTIRSAVVRDREGAFEADPNVIELNMLRQEALGKVRAVCVTCSGYGPSNAEGGEDGLKVECPILADDHLTRRLGAEDVAKAAECGIPALYNHVAAGDRLSVEEDEAYALCPFVECVVDPVAEE